MDGKTWAASTTRSTRCEERRSDIRYGFHLDNESGETVNKQFLISMLVIGLMASSVGFAQGYDLVIMNGRVIDPETGIDQVSNVAVKGGKIAVISIVTNY